MFQTTKQFGCLSKQCHNWNMVIYIDSPSSIDVETLLIRPRLLAEWISPWVFIPSHQHIFGYVLRINGF